jgi:hypothetical protein
VPADASYRRHEMWIEKTVKLFVGLVLLFVVVRHTPFLVGLIEQFIEAAARVADSITRISPDTDPT